MSESKFRRDLVKDLRARGAHAVPIEAAFTKGIPDLNWCAPDTWAELKYLKRLPVKEVTPVRLEHFTNEQVIWLQDRGRAGGRAVLMSQIGKEYFVHTWRHARRIQKAEYNKTQFWSTARLVTSKRSELIEWCLDEEAKV